MSIRVHVLAGGLALGIVASPTTPAARTQVSSARIVAVGDIHGAAERFAGILQKAGIVDAGEHWFGGAVRLVQTGDYMDRGAHVRGVLDLLMRLEQEAPRSGGRADILLGNHETMNMLHEFRDVSADAYAAFVDDRSETRRMRAFRDHTAIARRRGITLDRDEWMKTHPPGFLEYAEAMGPSGKYGRWLRSRKVVLKIGDTIFMHAGIRPDLDMSLDEVNRTIEREIRSWDEAVAEMDRAGLIEPFFTLKEIVGAAVAELQRLAAAQQAKEPLEEYVSRDLVDRLQHLTTIDKWALVAPEGPMWFRGYAMWGPEGQPLIERILKRYGAARFVVGHTPQPGTILSRLNDRVWLIDSGMVFKEGRPAALELRDGRATPIYAP